MSGVPSMVEAAEAVTWEADAAGDGTEVAEFYGLWLTAGPSGPNEGPFRWTIVDPQGPHMLDAEGPAQTMELARGVAIAVAVGLAVLRGREGAAPEAVSA